MRLYTVIFRLMPESYRKWVKDYIRYSDFSILPEKYSGFSILYGVLLSLAVSSFLLAVGASKIITILIGISTFLIFEVILHAVLVFVVDARAKFTEEILPDALRLMSSNLRSGLTPDKALMLSARPEFGPLEHEIKRAAKKTLSGESMEEAIQGMTLRIKSKGLKRSVDLLTEGMMRGGDLAPLLDGLADDIRQSRILKKEVSSYVMMYVMFIFFAVAIGAPLLYAISTFLVQTMAGLGSKLGIENVGYTGDVKLMTFKGVELGEGFLMAYSLLSLAVTSLFGGLLIGLIQEGSEKTGMKYIPVLMGVSLGVYFVSRMIVVKMFGGLIV